jgi:hypothetical protein
VKLYAVDGQLIRKATMAQFRTKQGASEDVTEHNAVVLTNTGEVRIYHVDPHWIDADMQSDCIKQQDLVGINSCMLTTNAHGYYHSSPSEFVRFSVSARNQQAPRCNVQVAEVGRTFKGLGRQVSTTAPIMVPPRASQQAQARPMSPQARPLSPEARPMSPQARPMSPQARPMSPQARPLSPQARPTSPEANATVKLDLLTPKVAAKIESAPSGTSTPANADPAVYYSMPPDLPAKRPPATKPAAPPPIADEDEEEEEEDDDEGAEAHFPPAPGAKVTITTTHHETVRSAAGPGDTTTHTTTTKTLTIGSAGVVTKTSNGAHADDEDEEEEDDEEE